MTEGLDLHLGVDKGAGFVGRALETALREAIRSGRLHAGARLPGSRSLAADLGISRGTVVQAYAQLIAEGWLRHTTPDKYSRQTLELSHETLAQISTDLLASLPPAVDSAALDSVLVRSREHIDQMARSIQAKSSPDFRRQLDSLRADEKIVEQIADGMPKQ